MQQKRAKVTDLTRMVVLAIGGLTGMGHAGAQAAAAPESTYSTFDSEKDCEVLDAAPADESGAWARLNAPDTGRIPSSS